ncbi:MAG TPA: M1 family aminopeptidase, partial [Candidatus Dormibacteraeota bacterium]|nr:M1 family aminopeptidase [Candidatus Dormibacteraeota bacterium]
LKTLRFQAERVHDFAWVACPDYVGSDTTWAGIEVSALVFREDAAKWREIKAQTVDALRHHTKLVGPYVWPRFTATEAYCGGGAMEYPMLVMDEPAMYSALFHSLDDTNAHEVGHEWCYGMLGSDERAHPWMDEGFTQYIEHDYSDTKYPRGLFGYVDRFPWVGRISALDLDEQYYLARAWARDERPIATPADGHPGYPTYGVAAYAKPASMLHTLRGMVGDSLFTEFLHVYYRRNLLRHPRPPDVIRAADDATGQDLAPFFRSWVETLDRPSFALGGIHRERAGTDYRTSVVVVRKEAMVLPVTVEATFADGTRQERRVLARERGTPAVFESRSPVRSARLDPRHEIIEMDRLDNGSGTLPPMRFHFLAGFPSAEAIGVACGPTIWHGEEEGLRLGGWMDGRYLPSTDFPYGIRGFEGGLSIGTSDGSVAYRAGGWRRVSALGARSRLRTLVARDEGLFRVGLHAENAAMAPARRHPYRSWKLSVEYRDRYKVDPVDSRYWSRGPTWNAGLTLGLETIGPRRKERIEISYRRGAASALRGKDDAAPDANYDWLRLSAKQDIDPLPARLK